MDKVQEKGFASNNYSEFGEAGIKGSLRGII